MKKLFFVVMCAALLVSCNGHKDEIMVEVYGVEGGYGYRIINNNRVLINQSVIPSMPGNMKFCDSIDAAKVGQEVVKKIQEHKTPAITHNDLQRLKIKLKC